MDIWQVFALIAFGAAAVLAALAHRTANYWWAVCIAVGLFLWLLSTTSLVK